MKNKFKNDTHAHEEKFLKTLEIFWKFFFCKPKNTVPDISIPIIESSKNDLIKAPDYSLYRLGHSCVLLKLEDQFILTDPMLSKRASPLSFFGPKRFHKPPISLNNFPNIRAVFISHDHYDHLDKKSVLALEHKTELFITPTGVGDILIKWGISPNKIKQLAWWESINLGQIELTLTPSKHFSGRSFRIRNSTLWSSLVIQSPKSKIFFSADGGYFNGFKKIGEKFDGFDISLLENGAYNENWADIHMFPDETIQAHKDLNSKVLIPIHNGTFDLSMHPWYEPLDKITKLAENSGIKISTPIIGERIDITDVAMGKKWWGKA